MKNDPTRHVTITVTEHVAEETRAFLVEALGYPATHNKRRSLLATARRLNQALMRLDNPQ